jgi:hypothetical protein
MAVAMMMRWDGVTPEQYEAVRKLVDWEGTPAAGGLFRVAGFDDRGLRVTDIWETPEAFQAFVADRLMPGVKRVGVRGEPAVEIVPVHALFAPAFERV